MADETATITIPERLYRDLRAVVEQRGLPSVSAYAAQVLEQAVERERGDGFAPDDEEQIKDRLRSLGYID